MWSPVAGQKPPDWDNHQFIKASIASLLLLRLVLLLLFLDYGISSSPSSSTWGCVITINSETATFMDRIPYNLGPFLLLLPPSLYSPLGDWTRAAILDHLNLSLLRHRRRPALSTSSAFSTHSLLQFLLSSSSNKIVQVAYIAHGKEASSALERFTG